MNLSRLLLLHALVTAAAGVVLILAPELIPAAVAIPVEPSAYLICYLLGSSELGMAFLSYFSRTLTDAKSLRLISLTFIVVHTLTAAVELYAISQGASPKIWANIALRILVALLFGYFGVLSNAKRG